MPRVRQTVGQLTQSAAISAPALSGAFFFACVLPGTGCCPTALLAVNVIHKSYLIHINVFDVMFCIAYK
jgi:hypothetical protein